MALRLVQPQSESDWRHARRLVEEYAASLAVDLSFQGFTEELENLPVEYGPPAGAFLLAEEEGVFLGCVGVRRFAAGIAEIKRLYVVPAARGHRVGHLLAAGIVGVARELRYAQLLLDTLPSMMEAQTLYASLGFAPTSAYRFNPVPGTVFMKLELG